MWPRFSFFPRITDRSNTGTNQKTTTTGQQEKKEHFTHSRRFKEIIYGRIYVDYLKNGKIFKFKPF